jgi:hypothetical protein
MRPAVKRGLIKRAIGYPAFLLLALLTLWLVSIRMPGRTWRAPLPPLTPAEDSTRQRLEAHVQMLAGTIGERGQTRMRALDSAAAYIDQTFRALGYRVDEQPYTVGSKVFKNLEIVIPGRTLPNENIVIGAHYDTVIESPGADDNSSGVAGVLELARLLSGGMLDRTVRLVAFVNEEPPFFFTEDMGSRRYARQARERNENIVAMLSMETIGHYSDGDGTQKYPPILGWFYPSRGDFVAFVGNIGSRGLVHRAIASFRSSTQFPSQGSAAPTQIPGISWSDQWSFWKDGYHAIMITDTAPFRNANYHTATDIPITLDYARMARVVTGISRVVEDLSRR